MRCPLRFCLVAFVISGHSTIALQEQESAASRLLKLLEDAKRSSSQVRSWTPEKSELLQAIAIAQAKAGDAKASERTFQEILQAAPEKEETRSVALAKVRAGDLKGALDLAEPLKDGWIPTQTNKDPLSGPSSVRVGSLRTDTLERIIGILLEEKRWKEAHEVSQLLPETKREGHPDDLTSKQEALMNLAIAEARAGLPEASHVTAKKILAQYYRELALQDIVTAQVKRGDFHAALRVVEEIVYPHLKIPSTLAIAAGQRAAGDGEGASATFSKAIALASHLIDFSRRGASSRVRALTQIAAAQAEAGDRPAALETMKLAMEGSDELDLDVIAIGQAKLGAFDPAVAKADAITEPWRRVHALIGISHELSRAKETAKARELLMKARSIAILIGDDYIRTTTLLPVGKGQLEAGDVSAAVETARGMMEISEKWDLLHLIVKAQVAVGDLKAARSTADLLKVDWVKHLAFREIAFVQARAGDAKAASELIDRLQGNVRDVSLEEMSSILLDRGEIELALQSAYRMEMTKLAGRALRKIASTQARGGDEAGPVAWASAQKDNIRRAYALLGIAEGLLEREGKNR